MSVCRQCHKTCLTNSTANGGTHHGHSTHNHNSHTDHNKNLNKGIPEKDTTNIGNNGNVKNDDDDDWQSLMLMGLSAININPAVHLVKLDPFSAPVPKIAVVPPTPDTSLKSCDNSEFEFSSKEQSCNCKNDNTTNNPRSLVS